MNYKLSPDYNGLSKALNIIKERLNYYKLDSKEITKSMLASEEVMNALLEHSDDAEYIYLSIRRILDEISVEISVKGKEFSFEKELDMGANIDVEDIGPDTERIIRNMILRSFVDDLKYRCRGGMNTVRISVVKSKKARLYKILGAMLLAVIIGVMLKMFVPEGFYLPVNDNVLIPIKTMFMNALKMIVSPVVFFSIVSCVGQFSDFSEIGKIGAKTIGFYFATTIIATLLGTGVFYIFRPGAAGSFVFDAVGTVVESQAVNVSFKDMIVNSVPNNFIKPFLDAEMLQLIFIAVLCGLAVGMLGKYSQLLRDLFTAFNELFLKITFLIIKFMPIAVFCSVLSMIINTGMTSFLSILGILGVYIIGLILMMVIYCILIFFIGGLNPIPFCKKYMPVMLQVFSMASSNASLPINIEACKRLGISPKVYSLSLPLGATINMDGSCIYFSIFVLAFARICGVAITPAALTSTLISIIVLSIGAPGIPGSGLVCLSVLLTQLNIPLEVVTLIMGIDPIIGMSRAMMNCLGDVAVSVIVANREGIMDVDTYKKL